MRDAASAIAAAALSSLSCLMCHPVSPIPGGYCGGVPPLPIPNREVKPACTDGTAMQCGRVGSRPLYISGTLICPAVVLPSTLKAGLFFVPVLDLPALPVLLTHPVPSVFFPSYSSCLFARLTFLLHIVYFPVLPFLWLLSCVSLLPLFVPFLSFVFFICFICSFLFSLFCVFCFLQPFVVHFV